MAEEMDRLLEETRRRLRESEALFRVSQAFTSVLDLDELLQVIVDSAVETIDTVGRGVIHILDEASGELQPKALSGKALGALRERKMSIGEGVAGYALERGTAINVPDVNREPLFVRNSGDPGLRSLLVVPLILGQKRIGTLSVDSERAGAFTEDDERLLTTLATQAAIAIENARLYEELREELTERKRTEEELRKSESRYRLLAENVTDVIWTMDMSLRFTYVSPSVTRMLGYSVKEVMGTTLQEILLPSSYEVIKKAFAEELAIEEMEEKDLRRSKTLELEITCKDGSTVWTEATMTFLRDLDGQPVGILGVTRDITERKAVDRLKSNIVANVSHEFRAPLASIKAYTELLLDELDEGDQATRHHFLTVIDEETDRLTTLVNDFLDLSRLESGRFALTRRPLNLGRVVDYVVLLLGVQARNRGIDIKLDVPSDLPAISADEELIATLIRNLLSNAVKFSYEGGQVEVKAWEKDGQLMFSISDQGIGIPSQDLPHLFEKFYRVHLAMESGIKGTGLGLALAKEAAEAHGGRIEVQSQVGEGSCFTVILPLAPPD